jgi:hypothetical protein
MSAFTPQHSITRFSIHAEAGPSSLPRVLEHFAPHNVVPEGLTAIKVAGGRMIHLMIDVAGMDAARIAIIAEKLRQSVVVNQVVVKCRRP